MPTIEFVKNYKPISASSDRCLRDILMDAGMPVASSCKGDGVCGKCRITISQGMDNLSTLSDLEKSLHEQFSLNPNERISCQAFVLGNVTLDTTYW